MLLFCGESLRFAQVAPKHTPSPKQAEAALANTSLPQASFELSFFLAPSHVVLTWFRLFSSPTSDLRPLAWPRCDGRDAMAHEDAHRPVRHSAGAVAKRP